MLLALLLGGCADPEYDVSTPEAALDAMHQMAVDGRADLMSRMIHIEARDITFDDGVTEASAIREVIDKTGDMLGRLYRVAQQLRERFPAEMESAVRDLQSGQRVEGLFGDDSRQLTRFLTDPFGLLSEQRARLSVEDLGDGTAAVLLDGNPMFGGLGLLMREVDGAWKIEVPIALLQDYRPNTRHEWAVLASLMLGLENSLKQFEDELDDGRLRNLAQASERAGRLLFESAAVQVFLYRAMKERPPEG